MPCYEKVLTRFSQVGAPKQKLFGLSVAITDLAYFCERCAPVKILWITNFPYHAHSRPLCKILSFLVKIFLGDKNLFTNFRALPSCRIVLQLKMIRKCDNSPSELASRQIVSRLTQKRCFACAHN